MLVIGTTTERKVLEQMDMTDAFNSEIYVPTITSLEGVDIVLQVREQEVTYVITSITDDLL